MILVFPLAIAVAAAMLWRGRNRPGGEGRGCRWFWAWAVVGLAITFSFLTGFSIRLLLLPFALGLLWLVLSRSPRWQESLGFVEGVGLMLLVVAFLHRSDRLCSSNQGVMSLAPGQRSISCGGLDPHPWLFAGAAVSAAAAAAYSISRRNGPVV